MDRDVLGGFFGGTACKFDEFCLVYTSRHFFSNQIMKFLCKPATLIYVVCVYGAFVRSIDSMSSNPSTQHTVAFAETEARIVILPPDYNPQDDKDFMGPLMLEYFRQKLLQWRNEILHETAETIHNMQTESTNEPDPTDRATNEIDRAFELRTRDRGRKLLIKIDEALERIENGTYGYCEQTGEPITVARLEARPIATLSLEAQERHEKSERLHSD